MEAVNAFKPEIVEQLLHAGAQINAEDNRGCTALMRAAYIGYPGMVSFLLEHGADKTHADYEGNLTIHYVRKECFEDLKHLLK